MTNYTEMCRMFAEKVDFNAPSPVGSPNGSPFDAGQLQAIVAGAAPSMTKSYANDYARPLAARLPELTASLQQELQNAVMHGADRNEVLADIKPLVDTLVGAVQDWNEPPYAKQLKRFEAVISNFYRSFLSRGQRTNVVLPLIETVPPLVTFAPLPDQGPFTMPADDVNQVIGVRIGVVSLPGSYRDHPLTWVSLAHECGGHDVIHADPGLKDELAFGVARLPGLPPGIGGLWSGWMDEAAADVYGLLNVGPSFGVNLAAFFSALRASAPNSRSGLGPISNVLPVRQGRPVDVHPVDLLRVYLAMGVTAQQTRLSGGSKTAWLMQLQEIANEAGNGATTIDVVDVDSGRLVQTLPLSAMAQAAQAVGGYIVTARLNALKGHSIQDIETWDDADETAAQTIFKEAKADKSLIGLGDDAQLLAGATMAFYDNPTGYDAITGVLNDALDDSFLRDPVFAPPSALRIFGEERIGRAYSHSPMFPIFPLDAFSSESPTGVISSAPRKKGRRR
jgi:hypothetical protein